LRIYIEDLIQSESNQIHPFRVINPKTEPMLEELFDEIYTLQGLQSRYRAMQSDDPDINRYIRWVLHDLTELVHEKFDFLLTELERGIGTRAAYVNNTNELNEREEQYAINRGNVSIRNLRSQGMKAIYRNLHN